MIDMYHWSFSWSCFILQSFLKIILFIFDYNAKIGPCYFLYPCCFRVLFWFTWQWSWWWWSGKHWSETRSVDQDDLLGSLAFSRLWSRIRKDFWLLTGRFRNNGSQLKQGTIQNITFQAGEHWCWDSQNCDGGVRKHGLIGSDQQQFNMGIEYFWNHNDIW